MLSFFEAAGPGKWTRVATVNGALRSHFQDLIHDEGPRLRKSMIRSFAWCLPINVPIPKNSTPYSVPDAESRWGVQLLAVTNDDNDVMFLRTQRSKPEPNSTSSHGFELLASTALDHLAGNYPMVHHGSVFSTAFTPRIKAIHLSCGPWLAHTSDNKQDIHSVTSNVAVVYGTKLRVIKLDIALTRQNKDIGPGARYKPTSSCAELAVLTGKSSNLHFTGPFKWLYTVGIEAMQILLSTYHLPGRIPRGTAHRRCFWWACYDFCPRHCISERRD